MNIDQIDAELDKQKPKNISIAAQYGVMGVCLGKDLHARLREHAANEKLPMSRIIKTLVEVYLREKYSKF